MTVIPLLVVPWSKHSSDQETNEYYAAKHALLSERLSSQFVDRKRLDDRNSFKWSVSNIGLGLFAKMGGIPWLVKPSTEKCLIVGIGQAHSIVNGITERYIAYSVLSDSTGLYEKIRVLGDTRNHKEYLNSLKANLKIVLTEHKGGTDHVVAAHPQSEELLHAWEGRVGIAPQRPVQILRAFAILFPEEECQLRGPFRRFQRSIVPQSEELVPAFAPPSEDKNSSFQYERRHYREASIQVNRGEIVKL